MKTIIENLMQKITEWISTMGTERLMKLGMLIIIGSLLLTLLIQILKVMIKFIKSRQMEKQGVLYEILSKDSSDAKATEALIKNLHSTLLNTKWREFWYGCPYLSFEIAARNVKDQTVIGLYVWIPKGYKEMIVQRIYAAYPQCSVVPYKGNYMPSRKTASERLKRALKGKKNESIVGVELELGYHHAFSLNKQLNRPDILPSIFAMMRDIEWHETVIVQIIARPVSSTWQVKARKTLEQYERKGVKPNKNGATAMDTEDLSNQLQEIVDRELGIKSGSGQKNSKTRYDRKIIGGATEKIMDIGFDTSIRLCVISNFKKGGGAKTRLKQLGSAFTELNRENVLVRKIIIDQDRFYKRIQKRRAPLNNKNNILSSSELATFFLRLPEKTLIDEYTEIKQMKVKELPAPPQDERKAKINIGVNQYRGSETAIGIMYKDLCRHLIVQGMTGSGKSEWAKTIMVQMAEQGLGFALFEPHGKLADETLQMIPKHRRGDVIIVDPYSDYPIDFNFCKVHPVQGKRHDDLIDKQAEEIIEMFSRIFSDAWSAKNAQFLSMAIKTVMKLESGTFIDVRRLFFDEVFRKKAIGKLQDEVLISFWRDVFQTNEKGKISAETQNTVNSLDYKITSFLNSKAMLRLFGQDGCVNFRDILDENKIIIFKFSKDDMSNDQVKFIGGLAIKMFVIEAFRRNKEKWNEPFSIIIDEAQNFVSPTIETILDELRKYGVSLIMMHQRLAQMDKKVPGLRDAIYNAAGNKITFTAGPEDAKEMAKIYQPAIDDQDVTSLPQRYGYAKILVNQAPSRVFSIYTLDSPNPTTEEATECFTEIMLHNRKGRKSIKEIDAMIDQRMKGLSYEALKIDAKDIEKYEVIHSVADIKRLDAEMSEENLEPKPKGTIKDLMEQSGSQKAAAKIAAVPPKEPATRIQQPISNLDPYDTDEYRMMLDKMESLLPDDPDEDEEEDEDLFHGGR